MDITCYNKQRACRCGSDRTKRSKQSQKHANLFRQHISTTPHPLNLPTLSPILNPYPPPLLHYSYNQVRHIDRPQRESELVLQHPARGNTQHSNDYVNQAADSSETTVIYRNEKAPEGWGVENHQGIVSHPRYGTVVRTASFLWSRTSSIRVTVKVTKKEG